MRVKVKIPKLGLTMTEAKIVTWLKQVGDVTHENEPLFVIETEKAEVEVPSPVTGTILEIVAEVGKVYGIGEPVAVVDV